ncbi:MAG: flagellar filament capping protein FliD [Azoarcus sp.]|jgi:flagellar hook-associated protein 2|nr:flagellar filament capping protein FliD [Azoarcus sp.]
MATVTSLGVGSGMDLETLVKNLMNVERLPLSTIQTKMSSYNTKISAMGTLSSKLSALQTAAKALKPDTLQTPLDKFGSYTAQVGSGGDNAAANAIVGAGAQSGSYDLEIQALAQAQKSRVAETNLDLDDANGLEITVDGKTTKVTPQTNTLSGLANAINRSDSGVKATIINDGGSKYLVLTGEEGEAKAFTLSGMGTENATRIQEGKDAEFTLDGIAVKTSSNTVKDVVPGVTLELKAVTSAATSLTVTAEYDTKLKAALEGFVKSFNDAVSSIKSLGSYDAETKATGALNGNRILREAQSALRGLVFGEVDDKIKLSDLGITFQKDGTLALDSDKLAAQITKDPAATATFAASIGTKFNTAIDKLVGVGGQVQAGTDSMKASLRDLEKRQEALEERLVAVEKRYRERFGALDTLMAKMTSTSSQLTSQLASISSS